MSYATQSDIESRYPGELAQAGPTVNGVLDEAAVALALLDASNKADGYLRAAPYRFAVPWPDPAPDWLADMVVDIALYEATPTALASQEDFKDRRKRYEDALARLGAIAAGRVNPDTAAPASTVAGVIAVSSTPRLFGRGVL